MSSIRRLVGSGVPPQTARNINGTFSAGQTSAGTSQATGFLQTDDATEFTTVGASSACTLNSNNEAGDEIIIANAGSNALLVYPEVGSQINALGANASFSLTNGKTALFKKVSATQYYSILTA